MQSSWRRLARETVLRWQTSCSRPYNPPQINTNLFRQNIICQSRRAFNGVAQVQQQNPSWAGVVPPFVSQDHVGVSRVSETLQTPDEAAVEQSPTQYRACQVAFEASRAVRLAVSQGELGEAYLVLNSIHHANNKSSPLLIDKLSSFMPFKAFQLQAIPFQLGTPIRLVAHSLLHSLLREGYLEEAARLSEQLMKQGIRMHWKTLDTVFETLTSPVSKRPLIPPKPHRELWSRNVLNASLKRTYIDDAGGSYALHLLNIARRSRQRRTRNMFKTLITLCVINGEIILASLLFGLLVRDWNTQVLEVASDGASMKNGPELKSSGKKKQRELYNRVTAWPSENRLDDILQSIERTLRIKDHRTEEQYDAALQALANLAVLLDNRLIPFSSIGPLLRLLTRAQNVSGSIKVPDKPGSNTLREVQASLYFGQVLGRLSHSLPTVRVKHASLSPPIKKNRGMLPALDLSSYNHLLRFALLQRHSPALADQILKHMSAERVPVLKPDSSTADIYRQAAVLLKEEELWKRASSFDQSSSEQSDVSMAAQYASSLVHKQSANEYVRKIDFLISTGSPHLVVEYIDHILPGYDGKHSSSVAKSQKAKKRARRNYLEHAVELGPRVFVSVLNALCKSGHTSTAEKVWNWAKTAEEASWTQDGFPAWLLPIEAYTLMLRIYGAEAKRGIRLRHYTREDGKLVVGAKENMQPPIGWGGYRAPIDGPVSVDKTRGAVGREMAIFIYRSTLTAYSASRNMEPKSGKFHIDHKQPVPDALFFNAALDVVGRQPDMLPRGRLSRLWKPQRYLRNAEMWYKRTGMFPRKPRDELLEVGKDMVAWGFPIPPALRPHFVGHGIQYNSEGNGVVEEEGEKSFARWRNRSLFRLRAKRAKWRAIVVRTRVRREGK